ncbi:MAG TPA: hypothetical protein VFY11_14700 [Nocardioidaceae bacterium]|nr:hypothetical protein [Nocardioidaceae bacterium]
MTETTVLASGLAMGESPRWHEDRLWVCDWMAGEVLSFDEAGHRRVERTLEGAPFSIDWLPDGRLVATSGGTRQVLREQADGSLERYGPVEALWNEVVVDGRGNTFVNEIGFDMNRVREGGEVLATVEADRGCFACMLGGEDGRLGQLRAASSLRTAVKSSPTSIRRAPSSSKPLSGVSRPSCHQ